MYAVVELLGNDYWKHKPKLNEIDQTISALQEGVREINMVVRLGIQNYHGFNYLATIYGRRFKLMKQLIKQLKAINVGKHQVEFQKLYVNYTIDPNTIYPLMKQVFEGMFEEACENSVRAAEKYPYEFRDECVIHWDTVNANFKKG